jgi:signal transduction histidine kinase
MFNSFVNDLVLFISIITFLTIVLVILIGYIFFAYQKRQLIYKKGIEEINLAHKTKLLDTKIQVQEHTFQQISSDIHDNIGQKLSLAKLQLNKIDFEHNHKTKDVINDVVQIITDSLNDLRDLSRSLSTDLIKSNGFIRAMENEIVQLNKIGHFVFKMRVVGDSVFLDVEKEVVLFRMAQEIIANIIKHSSARKIELELHFIGNQLTLNFADDGKGFEINKVKDSNGILNIKRRAETLGGNAVFTSTLGQGTIVNIKIPIND